jgi:hypothetical protein
MTVRAVMSHASWVVALIAVTTLLAAHGRIARPEDFEGFMQGVVLVVVCSAGLLAGILGLLLNLRPLRAALVAPLIGIAANAVLLWYFAPTILRFAF